MAFKTLPLGRVFIAKGRQTAGGVTLEALGVDGLAHFSANRMWVSGSQVLIFP
jgi:hypothetical protein